MGQCYFNFVFCKQTKWTQFWNCTTFFWFLEHCDVAWVFLGSGKITRKTGQGDIIMTVKCIYIKGLPTYVLPNSKGLLFWDTIHCWWPKTHLPIFDLHTTQSLPAYKRFQKSLLNSKGYVRSWNFSNKNMIDQSSNCVCQYYQENDIRDAVYKIIKDLLLKNDWVPAKFHWLNKRMH